MFDRNRPGHNLILSCAVACLTASSVTAQDIPDVEASTSSARETEKRSLTLAIGEQASIPADDVRSYSEGVPGVVDVRLPKDGSRFVVVALKPGTTTLLLIMMSGQQIQYTIRVTSQEGSDAMAVAPSDNIRLDLYFVQLSKSYNHQLGVGWPGAIGGNLSFNATYDVQAGALQNATAVVANQALPRLDIAQSNGWAKLMRQAAVITANGTEATFESGGEVNLPIQGALTAEIRKIEFGSNIVVLPRYDAKSGRIELDITADVSDLTNASGAAIPGRTTSALKTRVNLELGQSLVLAGLSSRTQTSDQTGLPGLSQIPILGALFGSNTRRKEEVENVIFIVPSVVDVLSQQARDRVTEAMNIYDDFSGGDLEEVEMVPVRSSRLPHAAAARPVSPEPKAGARR